MADIVKSNFEENLQSIDNAIKKSVFISFDAEFTGLNASPDCIYNLFDSMQQCYTKLRKSATSFIICQLGFTAFSRNEAENSYNAQNFTFYLRPHQFGKSDRCFLMQASALDFLNQFKFDFHKFAVEGIPYLNETEELAAEKGIGDGTIWFDHFRQLGEDVKKKHESFLYLWLSTAKDGDKTMLQLDKVGHEYFHLCYLRKKFQNLWAVVEDDKVIIEKVTLERRKELDLTIPEEEKKLLDFYVGFSRVFKILKKYKKPMVGHNALFDLMLIYHNFYKPLPTKYKQFKEEIHNLFPIIYDTKHMWLNSKRVYDLGHIPISSGLFDLYDMLKNTPSNLQTLFSPGIKQLNCEKYASMSLLHNAGYDSYVTGFVFVNLCHLFAMKSLKSLVQVLPQTIRQHLKAADPFKNRINVARARVHYIDLAQEDSITHRPDLLYLSSRKNTTPLPFEEVYDRLSQFGYVELQKMSATEVLVAVASFGCADRILNALSNDENLMVARYNSFSHSPVVKVGLVTTCISAAVLGSLLIIKSFVFS